MKVVGKQGKSSEAKDEKTKYRGKQMPKSEFILKLSATPQGLELGFDRSHTLGTSGKLWDLCGMEVGLEPPSSSQYL